MEEATCHESHSSACSYTKMCQLSDEVKESPDWLPSGWIMEIRTRKSGVHAGRQIKYYYDPSTDSRFYSKKAVFRHLNAEKVCGPIMRQTRSVTAKSVSECCSETNEEENIKKSTNNATVEHAPIVLPEGWTKEVRVRKGDGRRKDMATVEHAPIGLPEGWTKEIRVRKGDGRKKDTFYIDPVSKYAFCSLKDVFRYIETGDILQCATRPKKRESSGICTVEEECHSLTAAKKGGRRGNSVKKYAVASKGPDKDVKRLTEIYQPPESSSSPQWDHATSTTSEEDDLNCKIPNNTILDKKKLVFKNKKLSEHRNEKSYGPKKPKRGHKKKADQAVTMPVRASKRLAALRVNASNESETDERNTVEPEIDTALGSSAISPLANANSSASILEHPEKPENLEPRIRESCSQEQVKLGTLSNDKDPIFVSPFGDSWPDPCIEFAFKTLTSDIPFLDDLTAMQQYFQLQQTGPIQGTSLNHSLGNGNQERPNQNEHPIQLNPWNEHFVPFADDVRPLQFEQGLQSCKKVN